MIKVEVFDLGENGFKKIRIETSALHFIEIVAPEDTEEQAKTFVNAAKVINPEYLEGINF